MSSSDETIRSNFKDLFWEFMPEDGFDVTSHGNVNEAFKKIFFSRNENYELRCRLEANVGDDIKARMQLGPFKTEPERQSGVLFSGEDLTANLHKLKADIKGFRFNHMDANQDPCFIEGHAYQLHLTLDNISEETEFICYWYLNGFGVGYPFCRFSEKEFKTKLKMKIDDIEMEVERSAFGGTALDCMRLSINKKAFIFGSVDKAFSRDTPCSYLQFTKDNLPSKGELEVIENVLNFILGKIFMPIGHSKYNSEWLLIGSSYQDPYMYETNLKKIIKLPSYEPIEINRKRLGDIEILINQMLDKYSEVVKIFPLNEAIEAINMFRLFPFDLKIMPLSTAIDMIKSAWFKSDRSVSKGKHLADSNYNAIIPKHLDAIRAELTTFFRVDSTAVDKTAPIINRIKGANNLSDNERTQVFFSELGLEISELELQALRTRNIVVHGSTKERNDQQFIDNVHIYYTLVNKVLLRLLSYDGFYWDYGTHGCPQRQMPATITT